MSAWVRLTLLSGLALVVGCGPSCEDSTGSVLIWADNAPDSCPLGSPEKCDLAFCQDHCDRLEGTENATFSLAGCGYPAGQLVCTYTKTSEVCG